METTSAVPVQEVAVSQGPKNHEVQNHKVLATAL